MTWRIGQRNFSLQWAALNAKAHNWSKYGEVTVSAWLWMGDTSPPSPPKAQGTTSLRKEQKECRRWRWEEVLWNAVFYTNAIRTQGLNALVVVCTRPV